MIVEHKARNALIGWVAALMIGTMAPLVAMSQELSIAFVNWTRLTNEAPQAELALQALEAEFGPRDRQLAAEMADLTALEQRLARDGAVMSAEEQRRLQMDVVSRRRELRRSEEEFREDFNLRRNEELNLLHRMVIDAVGDVAEAAGLDLVVTDGVVYASERIDLTDSVLRELARRQ